MTLRRQIRALWAGLGGRVCFAAALSTVTLLSSCGGGDGPSSYALNVYVSGLTGSGLQVTLNAGAPIGISANSQTTIARLANGTSYTVAVNAQPINPTQTCSATNTSGKISGNNVDVMIACTADDVAQANTVVGVDPAVPSSASETILKVVSPTASAILNATLPVPGASHENPALVLALDATADIVLAALASEGHTTLSADSTALALASIALGPMDPIITASTVETSIRATAEYPNLVTLINAALAKPMAPGASPQVAGSVMQVVAQIAATPAATAAIHAVRSSIKSLSTPIVPGSPYTLLTWSGKQTAFQSVTLQGVTGTGDPLVTNGTSIAWSIYAADTQTGSPICGGVSGACETVLKPVSLYAQATIILGKPVDYPTSQVPATSPAYNLILQQSSASKASNAVTVVSDLATFVLTAYSGGKLTDKASCVIAGVKLLVSPDAVVAAMLDNSGSALRQYVLATLENALSPGPAYESIGACLKLAPKGAPTDFVDGLSRFVLQLGEYIATEPVKLAASSFGLGFEVGQLLLYAHFTPLSLGVCVGTDANKNFGITDCVKGFTFSPTSLYLAPGAKYAGPAVTAVGTLTATTLIPPDAKWKSSASAVTVDPQSGAITAGPSAVPNATNITLSSPSTGAADSYVVYVVEPLLSPSALVVDVTSAAQSVTVKLLGPNDVPLILPKGVSWKGVYTKDSDASTIVFTPVSADDVASTWSIPMQTGSGHLTVTAYDPGGTAYGSIAIMATVSAGPPPSGPPQYTVGNAGPIVATGANSSGAVVGVGCADGSDPDCASSSYVAAIALNGTVYRLDQYADLSSCGIVTSGGVTTEPTPRSITEQGVIVTQAYTNGQGVSRSNVSCVLTPRSGTATGGRPPLYTVSNAGPIVATGANSSGAVVGVGCADGSDPDCASSSYVAAIALNGTVYRLDQYADLSSCGIVTSGGVTTEPTPRSITEQGVIVTQAYTNGQGVSRSNVSCVLTPH